jgi:glycerol-3-phosphate acyltransferase PlsY
VSGGVFVLELGLKIFISYILGSINGALVVGRFFGRVDIRKVGSGNAGGTNALRTQGKRFAIVVMLIDITKGVLPVLLLPGLAITAEESQLSEEWLTYACGWAAIFGHCYPVWYEFRGGKGAATTLGVLGAISPILLVPAAVTWFGSLFLVGYVGLSTVVAGFSIPVFVAFRYGADQLDLLVFTGLIAVFVLYTHRSNMRNLLAGKEESDLSSPLLRRLRPD